ASFPNLLFNRFKRIWPSMAAMIVVVAALCTLFNHVLLTKLRADWLPALGFGLNWSYILRAGSYFEGLGTPSPLLHLWYLGVSEQFALIWIIVGSFVLANRDGNTPKYLLGAAGVSALLMIILFKPDSDPTRVYYGLDTRAFAPLIGAAFACIWPVWSDHPFPAEMRGPYRDEYQLPSWTGAGISVAGTVSLIGIILAMVFINDRHLIVFRGGMVLLSLMTVLVIAGCLVRTGPLHWILSLPPFVEVGRRSYAIYLWHYPFICLFAAQLAITGMPLKLLAIAISLVFSEAAWRFFENAPVNAAVTNTTPERRRRNAELDYYGQDSRELSASNVHRVNNRFSRGSGRPAFKALSWPVMAISLLVCTAVGAYGILMIPDETIVPEEAIVSTGDAQDQAVDVSSIDFSTPQPSSGDGEGESGDDGSSAQGMDSTAVGSIYGLGMNTFRSAIAKAIQSAGLDLGDLAHIDQITGTADDVALGLISPLIIGDSVPGDAWLGNIFPNGFVDTYIGRRPEHALSVYEGYRDQHIVGKVVIFAAFSNTTPLPETLDQLVEAVGDDRVVFLVGIVVPDGFQDAANANLMDCANRHPNVHYIDWPAVCAGHESEYLYGDYTHLTPDGAEAYRQMIAREVAPVMLEYGATVS
ncbi:MAG: acyltransferase, partial [Atopobiaceae bacterium]|nr:acyltransferase [Atopobiaceae bacterium]